MKSNYVLTLLCSFLVVVFMYSCKNEGSVGEKAQLAIRMTDAPADYDAVYIDVQDVQINVSDSNDNGWQSLAGVNRGVYNLLDLVNGKDTLLVNASIPTGK